MINTADHEPPLVHCIKSDAAVLIDIETGHIRDNLGMKRNDVRNAIALVIENQARLLQEWRRVFP